MTTVAVIPAYNEEEALPGVLADLLARHDITPVVVDDGSRDATADVARAAGVAVMELPFNLGYGGAKRAGLRWAMENGAERVVVIDADGQHDPADIQTLLDAVDDGAGLVIGSRFTEGSGDYDEAGRTRRGAMRSINFLVRLTTGFRPTDATSGFHAMNRSVLELLARENPIEYLADPVETILMVVRTGHDVREVPVSMRARAGGVPSSRNLRLIVNFLRFLVGLAGVASVGRRPESAA